MCGRTIAARRAEMIGVDGVAGPLRPSTEHGVQTFDSDGVRIAFIDEGAGDPILLIHGFASSVRFNWIDPGWVEPLTRNGFRVVALRQPRARREREALRPRPPTPRR